MSGKSARAGFFQAAKAVFWSFLGIRRRAQHEQDVVKLRPAQVIIAGITGALILVLALVMLVRFIVGHAT
jgi:hypothetical protein